MPSTAETKVIRVMNLTSLAKFSLTVVSLAVFAAIIAISPCASVAQQKPTGTSNKQAEIAFKKGVEEFEKGDYKAALDSLTTAIKLDAKFSEAYYYRGRVRDETQWRSTTGFDDYTAAIRINPDYAEAYLRRGMIRRYDYSPPTGINPRLSPPIDDFTQAIRIRPDFAEAYYNRGVARANSVLPYLRGIRSGRLKQETLKTYGLLPIKTEKFEELVAYLGKELRFSISDVTRATELNPRYVEAHSYLPRLYNASGEQKKAVASLTQLITILPDDAETYYRRGLAYLDLKEYQKANQDLTEAIRLRPNDAKSYNRRAVARFGLEDFDGALKDYVDGLKLKPNDVNEFVSFGDEVPEPRIKLEDFEPVLSKLTETMLTRLAHAYYERALARHYGWGARQEDYKNTVADLTRVVTMLPSHIDANYHLGLALSNLASHAGAVKAFSDVVRLQPQHAEAYYARGMSRLKLNDKQGALEDFSKAVGLSPEFTKAHYEKARVSSELGNQRAAIADFTRAIAIHHEFLRAYYLRGLAHDSLGENREAIADYLQVIRLANPEEQVKSAETDKLSIDLATIYYRGLARLEQALVSEDDRFRFYIRSEEEFSNKELLELAENDFTQLITARPRFATGYYQRGRARRKSRVLSSSNGATSYGADKKGALADFTRAIQLDPRHADAYFARGAHFKSELEPRDAIRELMRVTQLDPRYAKAFYMLGQIFSENYKGMRAQPKAAVNNYSLAIKANPDYVDALFRRAYLLEEAAPSKAIADYTNIIRLDPQNAGAYRGRAGVFAYLKDYRRALEDYTRAIELDPSEPGSDDYVVAYTYVNRANVRYQLGDGKGASEDYRQARIIRPCLECMSGSTSLSQANKADAFFQKGLALLRRGDKQAALKNFEEAARLFYTQGDMTKYQSVKYHLSRF